MIRKIEDAETEPTYKNHLCRRSLGVGGGHPEIAIYQLIYGGLKIQWGHIEGAKIGN